MFSLLFCNVTNNSIQVNFYLTYTEYYVHKVRMILQYYLTKIEEGKSKFDNMLLQCRVWDG